MLRHRHVPKVTAQELFLRERPGGSDLTYCAKYRPFCKTVLCCRTVEVSDRDYVKENATQAVQARPRTRQQRSVLSSSAACCRLDSVLTTLHLYESFQVKQKIDS